MNSPPDTQPPDPDGFALPIGLSGHKRGPLFARLQTAGIVVLLVAVAGIPISVGAGTWAARRASLRAWLAAGPACPIAATPSPATRGAKPPPPFVYKGVRFAYQIGDVICEALPVENIFSNATFPGCSFDAPAAIEVTMGARKVLFEPGVGHSAIVTVRDGKASCTIGAAFRD